MILNEYLVIARSRTTTGYILWQHYRWHEHTAADCERAVLVRGLCWQRHFTAQRQVEADETGCCSARGARAQPRRSNSRRRHSNSRRRAHLGPVRGSAREHSRGSAGVPAPPGESGVGERREAAGAAQGSAAAASEARTTRVRRRARTHGGAARGCTERILCDGVAHGCGGRSWGGAAWELLVPELTPPR